MVGQVGRIRGAAVPGIAVLLAGVLLAAVALAALRSGTASAPTVLREGAGVTATLPDGSRRALAVGDDVPPGASVAAGPDGAVLRTRDRDVHLGRSAVLTVVDGARQVLTAGFVMVDARRGPGVDVETAAAVVTTPDGAVSRVERGALLRVGAFSGDAVRVQPIGRRASTELPRWTQTQVPTGGLPGDVTPLRLTGDRYERRLAADLVADDRALADLARTLDSGGAQGPAVLAALEADLPAAAGASAVVPVRGQAAVFAAGGPASERALAYLLAAAQSGATDALAERYGEVRALRADGGSWGPVARLVDAEVSAVGRLIDRLVAPFVLTAGELAGPVDLATLLVPGTTAATTTGAAAGAGAGAGVAAAPPPADGPPPTGDGPPPPDDGPPPADDGSGPTDPPGPVPPPPDDPVGTVTDAVETVVETVIGLLPDPPPPPLPLPPLPPAPLPDAPAVDEPLVGSLLG